MTATYATEADASDVPPSDDTDRMAWGVLALLGIVAIVFAFIALRPPSPPVPRDTVLESGTHLTYVLVAPSAAREDPEDPFIQAVGAGRDAMREYAEENGHHYTTIGISDHWVVSTGLEIIDQYGPFDEIVIGRNWFNSGITRFISDMGGLAAVPQVVVLLQEVRVDTIPFVYGEPLELARLIGLNEAETWATANFPLNSPQIRASTQRSAP